MKTTLFIRHLWLPVLLVFAAASASGQLIRPAAGAVTGMIQEDAEVETSGPVHEGFASPVVFEEESEPFYAEVDPPHLIEEAPPLERPEGYSEWVPGYWSWDDDRRNYLWVSGTWRVPPPAHVWISGYWIKTWRGWRYVSGYWAPAGYGNGEIEYLPAPPGTLEGGPIGYPPSPNAIWIPGNWVWYSGGFMGWVWRPGYWLIVNPTWVWVPAHFTWTPYGYVYVEGHWDYPVDHCGLLFAPVYFRSNYYATSGYTYTPSFVINISLFSVALFTRPSNCHYYFGDYYAQNNWNHGIYPAYSFHNSKYGYDPHFAHANWKYGKGDPKWMEQQRAHFLYLRDHQDERPPKTLAQQIARPKDRVKWAPGVDRGGGSVAVQLKDAGQATSLKVEKIPESERGRLNAQAQEMRKARAERVKQESQGGSRDDKAPEAPRKIKTVGFVPGSVAAAATTGAGARVDAPKRPELPKTENVQVDPRRGTKEGRPSKLRDPSVDLPPDRGGKRGDDAVGKKPVDDKPAKKPGDDRPAKRPGDDQPPTKKPAEDQPPTKRPDVNPPKRGGNDQPPTKKPADDQPPAKRPEFNPPKRGGDDQPPTKKPADDQPPAKRPDVNPPKRGGNDQPPTKRPEFNPPKRGGNDQPPTKKPADDQPPTKQPELNPPKRGGDDKPVKRPGDDQPSTKKPGDQGGTPPTKDPRGQPPKAGERPPRTLKPGEQPESQPVKKPSDKDKDNKKPERQ